MEILLRSRWRLRRLRREGRRPAAGGQRRGRSAARCSARHDGVHRFTVGQRKGLGVARPRAALRAAHRRRRGRGGGRSGERARALRASPCCSRTGWRARPRPDEARPGADPPPPSRARRRESSCRRSGASPSGPSRRRARSPPGQAAVFYRGDEVLGGGGSARSDRHHGPTRRLDPRPRFRRPLPLPLRLHGPRLDRHRAARRGGNVMARAAPETGWAWSRSPGSSPTRRPPSRSAGSSSRIRRIRAVVVRIDSPGGAVGPSQEILEAMQRLREKKHVLASMGSIAASGGFYIAMAERRSSPTPAP